MSGPKQKTDLHWQNRVHGELLRLAWPITVSMLSYSVMTTVDTLFVGRLGASALAGVGLGGVLAFIVVCFGFGCLRSVKVLISQALGAGDRTQVPALIGAGLLAGAALGIVALVAGVGLSRALPGFTASAASGEQAATYLLIRSLGSPVALLCGALREARYAQSDSRSPMVAALIANVLHIPIGAYFIFSLDWGVAGAAWATVLSQAVELLLLAKVSPGLRAALAAVERAHLGETWRLGWPLGVQFLLEVGAFATLVALLARISEIDLAAHQIVLQFTHASFLPALAVGEAASILAGQAVGANRDTLVKPVARAALLVTTLYTGACGVILAVLAPYLVMPFTSTAAVAALSIRLCYIAAAFQVFDGASIVARSVLRGTGDVRFPAVIGVCTAWLCTPPLTYLLGMRLELGAVGGWLALCLEIMLGAAVLWWRFERGAWKAAARSARTRVTGLVEVALTKSPA
ncbi:MAG TPA: MATE family efflux transporter [Polyangiaceae bacterium]|nr:MATE family efflux transporter [Polyangiaceae bacterium]